MRVYWTRIMRGFWALLKSVTCESPKSVASERRGLSSPCHPGQRRGFLSSAPGRCVAAAAGDDYKWSILRQALCMFRLYVISKLCDGYLLLLPDGGMYCRPAYFSSRQRMGCFLHRAVCLCIRRQGRSPLCCRLTGYSLNGLRRICGPCSDLWTNLLQTLSGTLHCDGREWSSHECLHRRHR